jgi:acetolactate synthase-1/2/3 large subunit
MVEPYPFLSPHPDLRLIEELVARINAAERPVLLVGSGAQYAGAWQELIHFSERFEIPVLTGYKRPDAFPNSHPHYVGNLTSVKNHARTAVLGQADLIVAVGSRLEQHTSGGFSVPQGGQSLIQIGADETTMGQNVRPHLGVLSDVKLALASALSLPGPRKGDGRRASWIAENHAAQVAYSRPPTRSTRHVSMERVMADLRAILPPDAMTTADAGNFGVWVQRYTVFDQPDSYFSAALGCMGPGVPAAIAAKLAYPRRVVVAHVGDGGFLMTGQEMATAKQYGVKIITIVYNNGAYAAIRMHQESQFPGRRHGTDLVNPDFAGLGIAYGALGLKVNHDQEFLPALKKAIASEQSTLIEVSTDLEYITPTKTLSEIAGEPLRNE